MAGTQGDPVKHMLFSELCAQNISFAGKNIWMRYCSVLNVLCTKSTQLILEIIICLQVCLCVSFLILLNEIAAFLIRMQGSRSWYENSSGRPPLINNVMVIFVSSCTHSWQTTSYYWCGVITRFFYAIRQTGCYCSIPVRIFERLIKAVRGRFLSHLLRFIC